jgi:Ca2+-binding EF-hand superfamily protein
MQRDGFSRAGRFLDEVAGRGEETDAMKTTGLLFAALTLAATGALADERWKAQREATVAQAFAQADADHNGALSLAEFATFVATLKQIRLQNRFARLDANGDGPVALAEIEAAPRHRHACGGGGH